VEKVFLYTEKPKIGHGSKTWVENVSGPILSIIMHFSLIVQSCG